MKSIYLIIIGMVTFSSATITKPEFGIEEYIVLEIDEASYVRNVTSVGTQLTQRIDALAQVQTPLNKVVCSSSYNHFQPSHPFPEPIFEFPCSNRERLLIFLKSAE